MCVHVHVHRMSFSGAAEQVTGTQSETGRVSLMRWLVLQQVLTSRAASPPRSRGSRSTAQADATLGYQENLCSVNGMQKSPCTTSSDKGTSRIQN